MSSPARPAAPFKTAWLLALGYGPILPIAMVALKVDYRHITQSLDLLLRGVVLPMVVLTAALATVVTRLGWWPSILWEKSPAPRWLLLIPLLQAAILVHVFNPAQAAARGPAFLLWAALGTLCVGFNEEIVYRGIAVVGLRHRLREWQVWLCSSLLFALIHFWNYFAGQGLEATVAQLASTFLAGSFFYAARRASGTILVPMGLHALWDWTLFVSLAEGSAPQKAGNFTGYCIYGAIAVFVIGARWLFRPQAAAST